MFVRNWNPLQGLKKKTDTETFPRAVRSTNENETKLCFHKKLQGLVGGILLWDEIFNSCFKKIIKRQVYQVAFSYPKNQLGPALMEG